MDEIFNNNLPFGGLVVIFSGDPRQIPPVQSPAFYEFQSYYPAPGDIAAFKEMKHNKLSKLKQGEIYGLELYMTSTIHVSMPKNIRLENPASTVSI